MIMYLIEVVLIITIVLLSEIVIFPYIHDKWVFWKVKRSMKKIKSHVKDDETKEQLDTIIKQCDKCSRETKLWKMN